MLELLAALLISTAKATEYQQCQTSSTCTIGEFLYNDDYSVLTGASCTITAKNPDGTPFVTAAAMTGRSDGWYSYDATLSTTTGLYTTTICCTPASGLMCLDKSFEVKTPVVSGATPADIWSYSDRTLTSYGTLISDIWNYSTRSLTSFGSLVSDVWGYSNKTLTSFDFNTSSTPAPSTLQNIMAEQTRQREILEKLVNAPVVTLELEDSNTPDLSQKLEDSKKQAGLLYDSVQSSKSRLMTLDEKWSRLSADALSKEITSLSQVWNNPETISSLSKSWNTKSVTSIADSSATVKDSLTSLLSSSATKSNSAPAALLSAVKSLSDIEDALGDVTSDSSDQTFYGYLSAVSEKDELFLTESQKLSSILDDWEGTGESILKKKINDSQDKLLAINEFPGGESVVEPSNKKATGKAALKNLVFSLQGLAGLNRARLASAVDSPVRGLWLEEGSIIFRAVITNPSSLIAQSAPIKFFLPKELKMEDIMTIDSMLSAGYDTVADSLAVTGTFDLKPGVTKIVAVEVNDVWQLSDDELAGITKKAADLTKSLEKSALLSQGIMLKGDIESSVQKLLSSQIKSTKPENRIKLYREAQLELLTVGANMTQLENLVAQATGNSSIMGFVGGVSTTAVFGIILVVVAGFVFMSSYFKRLVPALANNATLESVADEATSISSIPRLSPLIIPSSSGGNKSFWQMPSFITAVVVVTAVSTVALTRMAGGKPTSPQVAEVVAPSIIPSPVATPTPSPSIEPSPSPSSDLSAVRSETKDRSELSEPLLTHRIEVPSDSSVNIRNKPSSSADIIMALKESQDIVIFKEDGEWRNIGFSEKDTTKGYWVNIKFIVEK
jgi:hypothetical protein